LNLLINNSLFAKKSFYIMLLISTSNLSPPTSMPKGRHKPLRQEVFVRLYWDCLKKPTSRQASQPSARQEKRVKRPGKVDSFNPPKAVTINKISSVFD
jgi:hypothetical protein